MTHRPIDPATRQQVDRSNDPDTMRELDKAAPEQAMISRRQRLTGQATGIGSVGFQETGAFDVGDGDHPATDTPAKGS
ncbi:Tat pathway signal protein [Brevundimonas sp. SL130]|uniref:Tat pathway signal protein n=1 Tax=Brevundimonas sp. SL130 TaxID=2995143 RepID=UPI00226D0115|nr:Tat pathway signal protein [Brevundimonas sp. SL130]WAC59232.1 Tat pathway signal protein [Brevundimonas sp. SL130]